MTTTPGWYAAVILSVVVMWGQPSAAQSADELRSGGGRIAAEMAAQRGAGRFDVAAQERAVEQLGTLVLGFIQLSDRAARSGREQRQRNALRGAYRSISEPLDEIYARNSASIERKVKRIMQEDGDLEALYETPEFKDEQLVASHALYFRNWLHYYGARLYEGQERSALLENARRGFSEFAVGDRRTELLVESLLGRGLCHLELGNTKFAIHDLKTVSDDTQASAERRSKARLALLDAYVRGGHVGEALRLSERLLETGGGTESNWIRFLRARALLDAAKKASGAEARRYRQEALRLMDRLRRAGGGWGQKVTALMQTGIDDPQQWSKDAVSPFAQWELAKRLMQQNEYAEALPLLQGFVSSDDAALRRYQGEAHYFLGLAQFQAGQHREAAAHFAAALTADKPSYGADAAYMQFKALEALVAASPSADVAAQYAAAVRTYLSRYPTHPSAFEAQFRLGELLQAERQFAEAIDAYDAVRSEPALELQAEFAALQCQFELLQGEASPQRRDAMVNDIGVRLRRFGTRATEFETRETRSGQVPLQQMRAKVAVMRALHATLQPEPDHAAALVALVDFEKQYPQEDDLLSQVVRLRVAACQRLGRFADAETEVQAHGALLLAQLGPSGIEDLAAGFVREGARRAATDGPATNRVAQQVALRLYELLVSDDAGTPRVRLTLARLYENTGQLKQATALYSESLQSNGTSAAALRGLARIAETENRLADARTYWQRLGEIGRPGDLPWYQSIYHRARLAQAMGEQAQSCDLLEQLKPAMPGLANAELRTQLNDLYQQVCR